MRLKATTRFSYGVGHVFNDLCASMWFTYTLIFFSKVLLFSEALSGAVVLIGQIADGLATPFVGYFSDRGDDFWFCKYGRRKTWHILGSIFVLLTFPFIFSPCIGCADSDHWAQLIYYSAFIIIFQFGWASVQISHLSLVPELTPDKNERTSLLAIRYSFTVISNLVVYIIMLATFRTTSSDPDAPIEPKDSFKFQVVAYTVTAVGAVFTIIFHFGVKEAPQESLLPQTEDIQTVQVNSVNTSTKTIHLFKDIRLYQVAVMYMATRLFANISQTILPVYLHDGLSLGAESLAIQPLVMYASSFVTSVLVKSLNANCGRKFAYMTGGLAGIAVSTWIRFGAGNIFVHYGIYGVAALLGFSSSVMLVTSLGITSDLIGQDCDNGAFIYGLMSFCDKLSNGGAVMMIQAWKCFPTCQNHYRDSLSYVCGGSAVLGMLAIATFWTSPLPASDSKASASQDVNETDPCTNEVEKHASIHV